MREIKFRAWDTGRKKMFGAKQIHFYSPVEKDGKLSGTQSHEVIYGWNDDNSSNWGKVGFDCILMQYTGLKDKNGVEIYEGDVIREDSPPHHCGEIKYDRGAFYISGIINDYSELCHTLVDDFWAIIGNIYENPELLKEK